LSRLPACPLCAAPEAREFAQADGRVYHRCSRCRLTFLAPSQLPDRETELATYRLHQNDPDDPRYRAFLARLTGPLLPHLRPGMVGLDFGCGPGPAIGAMLAPHGLEVTGYDPFFRPDRAALERTYEFITCTEVVEHLHHPGRELALLDRLLRPGGILAVMTLRLEDDDGFARWWYRREPSHVSFYRRETMAWIAGRFGWQLELPAPTVALFAKPNRASPGSARAATRSRSWRPG
jgi:2-polyprenyl-3-methyl-5-hydroxy-6-metoxy-1,4-benzoquinol methylase